MLNFVVLPETCISCSSRLYPFVKGAIINEVGMLNCASEDQNPICVEPLRRLNSERGGFFLGTDEKQPGKGILDSSIMHKNHMKSLHLEEVGKSDNVSQWNVLNSISLDVFLFEVPNSGQNPGKNQEDGGESVDLSTQEMKSWNRLKDRSCPVNDQLPHGMATFIEKLFASCHQDGVVPCVKWKQKKKRQKFSSFFVLQSQIQIKKCESSSKAF